MARFVFFVNEVSMASTYSGGLSSCMLEGAPNFHVLRTLLLSVRRLEGRKSPVELRVVLLCYITPFRCPRANRHHTNARTAVSVSNSAKMSAPFVVILFLAAFLPVDAFVIAPPWANAVSNPCSARSWQLIYWPQDGKCYPIFSQGPCPRSQELAFNDLTKLAECRCPKELLYWPATDR